MRIISLNANGIRAAARKGFFQWLEVVSPDVVCLQETKAQQGQLDETFYPNGYHCYYTDAEKKGYSGVAIYSRLAPKGVEQTLDLPVANNEGRYIALQFDAFNIASIYFPSGTMGETRQAVKYMFMDFFEQHLAALKQTAKPWILCGDWNIAHREIDLKNWRANRKHSGFLPEERAWMDKLFGAWGYVDAFRQKQAGEGHYTWWSHRGNAWQNNVGWRIDYQVVSPELAPFIDEVHIYKEQRFSDHAPLIIDYKEAAFV